MEFNETDRKQDLNVLYHVCIIRADQLTKLAALASKKVAHCTQVHDMWPFGPLVLMEFVMIFMQ